MCSVDFNLFIENLQNDKVNFFINLKDHYSISNLNEKYSSCMMHVPGILDADKKIKIMNIFYNSDVYEVVVRVC